MVDLKVDLFDNYHTEFNEGYTNAHFHQSIHHFHSADVEALIQLDPEHWVASCVKNYDAEDLVGHSVVLMDWEVCDYFTAADLKNVEGAFTTYLHQYVNGRGGSGTLYTKQAEVKAYHIAGEPVNVNWIEYTEELADEGLI